MTKAKCCICKQEKDIFGWVLMTQHKSLSLAYCPECYQDKKGDEQEQLVDCSNFIDDTSDLLFCFKS